jgi:hypothetical protein
MPAALPAAARQRGKPCPFLSRALPLCFANPLLLGLWVIVSRSQSDVQRPFCFRQCAGPVKPRPPCPRGAARTNKACRSCAESSSLSIMFALSLPARRLVTTFARSAPACRPHISLPSPVAPTHIAPCCRHKTVMAAASKSKGTVRGDPCV